MHLQPLKKYCPSKDSMSSQQPIPIKVSSNLKDFEDAEPREAIRLKLSKLKKKAWKCELISKQSHEELLSLLNFESDDSELLIPMPVQPKYDLDDIQWPSEDSRLLVPLTVQSQYNLDDSDGPKRRCKNKRRKKRKVQVKVKRQSVRNANLLEQLKVVKTLQIKTQNLSSISDIVKMCKQNGIRKVSLYV